MNSYLFNTKNIKQIIKKKKKQEKKRGFIMLFVITSISLLFTTFIIIISEKQFILLNKQKAFILQRNIIENDYKCINTYIQDAINVYYNIDILNRNNYKNCQLKDVYMDNDYLHITNNSIKIQHKFMFSPHVF